MAGKPRVRSHLVTVLLTCTHQITVRNPPLSIHVKYNCTAGVGCGYMIGWVSYSNRSTGITSENPLYKKTEG